MSPFHQSFLQRDTQPSVFCFHSHPHQPLETGSQRTRRTSRVLRRVLGVRRGFGIPRSSSANRCRCNAASRRCWRRGCTRAWRSRWRLTIRNRLRRRGRLLYCGFRAGRRRTWRLRLVAWRTRSPPPLHLVSMAGSWYEYLLRPPCGFRQRNLTVG